MSSLLRSLAKLQLIALSKVRDLARPGGLSRLFDALDYDASPVLEVENAVWTAISAIDTIDDLANRLIYGVPRLEEIPELVSEVTDLIDNIKSITIDFDGLPEPFNEASFWETFPLDLAEYLFLCLLKEQLPIVDLLLLVADVITIEVSGRERLNPGALSEFLENPGQKLSERFGLSSEFWSENFGQAIFERLYSLGLDIRAERYSEGEAAELLEMNLSPGDVYYEIMLLSGAKMGTQSRRELGLRLLPNPTHAEMGLGLFAEGITNNTNLKLGKNWQVGFDIQVTGLAQMVLSEGQNPQVILPDILASAELGPSTSAPILITGEPEKTRLDLNDFELGFSISTDGSKPEVKLYTTLTGLNLFVVPGDNFLSGIMGADLNTSVDFDISWSSKTGVTMGGSAGLNIIIPSGLTVGPVTLTDFEVALAVSGSAAGGTNQAGGSFTATSGVIAELGPFTVEVSEMGVEMSLVTAEVNEKPLIGPYNVAIGVKPPTRFSLSIDTEAVKGGGFLDIDPTRYSGALMIDVLSVGISAITVIDTVLPGNPDGWSFFAALSLEFPALPLGFGFTLSGVGGLVALNRGFDENALALGLRNGAVDSLLFPDDPINDAAAIIASIDDYFPPMEGNTVIGPMVQIGWGAPKTLLTAEIGVLISLPEGKIGILGSIAVLLPDPEAALLTLNLDVLGVVDVPGGTFLLVASLYDSQLLQTIELSGDMGAYMSTRDRPYFLMSVGGYNPNFQPPDNVPAVLHDLRRMRASIEIGSTVTIAIEAYFALTSNTVQFGTDVFLEASVKIWPTTYSARGELGFHIFLRFSPFKIVADFYAAVGVYSGNKELMGVALTAHLEGPKPWYCTGTASFKFFGINVNFEVEVGSTAASEPKPVIPLRADVREALESRKAWQSQSLATGVGAEIIYIETKSEDETDAPLWVQPDHIIIAKQSVVPLNRTIEIVGQGVPDPDNTHFGILSASLSTLPDMEYEEVKDWFAPAHFENLSKQEKLTRASFEEMAAGVSFGQNAFGITQFPEELGRSVTVDHEESLYEDQLATTIKMNEGSLERSMLSSSASLAASRVQSRPQNTLLTIEEPQFSVISNEDGASVNAVLGGAEQGLSQYEAMQLASGASSQDQYTVQTLGSRSNLQVVPSSAALEAA